MKSTVFFAHANGFPSPCYRKLFLYLSDDFDISYIEAVGHQDAYPVTDNWSFLTKELIQKIEHSQKQPVIGVGHSLGGVLHFLAACERPDLYSAIIMLDSPVYGSFKSWVIKLLKQIQLIDKVTPAGQTKNRRTSWPNRQELANYLKQKPLFQQFDAECLQDYIEFGTYDEEGKVSLRFDREIEYAIYRTIPHHLNQVKQKLTIPCGLVYGEESKVLQLKDVQYMKNALNCTVQAARGGHMFPFEFPKEAAYSLKRVIQTLA